MWPPPPPLIFVYGGLCHHSTTHLRFMSGGVGVTEDRRTWTRGCNCTERIRLSQYTVTQRLPACLPACLPASLPLNLCNSKRCIDEKKRKDEHQFVGHRNVQWTSTRENRYALKMPSVLRESWMGCDGLRIRRFFGIRSRALATWLKSGRSSGLNTQHDIRISCKRMSEWASESVSDYGV